jgi:membrane associated rhomboid family serine protease
MIPLSDNMRSERFPIAGLTVALLCIVVFFIQILLNEPNREFFTQSFGYIPAGLLGGSETFGNGYVPTFARFITYMYLHGTWWHLLSNLLFLWIFADNVEDAMGPVKYVLFYLLCGTFAALAETWATPQSVNPIIGASGGVSGVLGAYLLLHPKAEVSIAVPIVIVVQIVRLPAWVVLLSWFLLQVVLDLYGSSEYNIAFKAHIAGFIAGMVLAFVFIRGMTGKIAGRIFA